MTSDERQVLAKLATKRLVATAILFASMPLIFPWFASRRGEIAALILAGLWMVLCGLIWPYLPRIVLHRSVGLWVEGGRLHLPHGSVALQDIVAVIPSGHVVSKILPDALIVVPRIGQRQWIARTAFRTPYDEIVSQLRALGLDVRDESTAPADVDSGPR